VLLNSDAEKYAGSNVGCYTEMMTDEQVSHGQRVSLNLTLPPLATIILRPQRGDLA
jgi:1,4-alpha-glucan branching enzyme